MVSQDLLKCSRYEYMCAELKMSFSLGVIVKIF